jgi:ferredoxin
MDTHYFLHYDALDQLIHYLTNQGFQVKAPTIRDNAVVYDDIDGAYELPWGYIDKQEPANYKVTKTDKKAAFAWSLPAHSVKPMLFEEKEAVWKVNRNQDGKLIFEPCLNQKRYAILGVRPCDLRAIEIQDKVFIDNTYQDIRYKIRRESAFIIAANCTTCHSNCFCVALGGSPHADSGFDLAMTEIDGGFVIECGSAKGLEAITALQLHLPTELQINMAKEKVDQVRGMQTKSLPPIANVEKALANAYHHPRWQDVAQRCLSCGSCTHACPTCFCHTEKDEPSLDGKTSQHTREWSSCFSLDHSYTHGQLYRDQPEHRYRQWLIHKFSSWREQFKTKGCVGCGRCITWCPVKIDVTEEIRAICGKES